MVILKNGKYLSSQGGFIEGDIYVKDGFIQSTNIEEKSYDKKTQGIRQVQVYDIAGKLVIPGLIDMHTHGAIGYDISTATPAQICELTKHYSQNGITSFMPTTMTTSRYNIKDILKNIKKASQMEPGGASIEGVHIEGPFINAHQKGAHDPDWITKPRNSDFDEYRGIMGDLKVHLTVAPEVENGLEFIEYAVKNGGTVGIGHTAGDYETILKGIEAGASIFTHLFNAMTGMHHRKPGAVGVALASKTSVEIIADGIHLHPEIIKIAIKAKGIDSVVLITDSIHATGLEEGQYEFGGFKAYVKDGKATKEDGTIVGSTLALMDAVRNTMKYAGISLEDAVRMATINPARILGLDDKIGSIEIGKRGDLVVMNDDIEIDMVFCRGQRVK
ncbi:MAG TPA: N-acetylglucosamine-6-phosphate deacetylase [Clostridia bacterium]|nr:N-acetylglucosamine-6-phosphate deacetylase [Clostridia bacterium]